MSKKRILLTVLLVLAVTFSFIGCGKKEPDLTGKWIEKETGEDFFELFSDGTGKVGDYAISWMTENNIIVITADLGIAGIYSYA